MEFLGSGLEQLLYELCRFIGWIIGKLWGVYLRFLNLPILVAVGLDCVAGAVVGGRMMGSVDTGTFLLGLLLVAFACVFFPASVIAWVMKVRGEKEDDEYLLRHPRRAAIAVPAPAGLDSLPTIRAEGEHVRAAAEVPEAASQSTRAMSMRSPRPRV
ncbi:MAG TPA: hypothetical protein VF746_20670 [Longimicrobium sp.]|jgi:hypothetical protein